MNLGDYSKILANNDFHRSNMFSVVIASTPSSKSHELLEKLGGSIFDMLPDFSDFLGINRGVVDDVLKYAIKTGTRKVVDKLGNKVFLIGAMSNRVIQSLLGEFTVGTYILDFFNMAYPTKGLQVYEVGLPENRIGFEMDYNHNAPNIKLTGRENGELVLSFRTDPDCSNLRAMDDWVNSVEDPVTGLRSLPVDVEADIQVNLHDRQGVPHTVMMFQGCIPVAVSRPKLSYEDNNSISTFDVSFAYRVQHIGAVGRQAAIEWLEDRAISGIERVGQAMRI